MELRQERVSLKISILAQPFGYFSPFEPRVDNSNPQDLSLPLATWSIFLPATAKLAENYGSVMRTAEGTSLVKDINTGFDDSEYIYTRIGKSRRIEDSSSSGF